MELTQLLLIISHWCGQPRIGGADLVDVQECRSQLLECIEPKGRKFILPHDAQVYSCFYKQSFNEVLLLND